MSALPITVRPCSICLQTGSLDEVLKWKAIEFHEFMLYSDAVQSFCASFIKHVHSSISTAVFGVTGVL